MKRDGYIKIVLPERRNPSLFLNEEELARIRELAKNKSSYQYKRVNEIRKISSEWMADPIDIPHRGAGGSLKYACFDDGYMLRYDKTRPHEHVCPKCGKIWRGEEYDGSWYFFSHQKIGKSNQIPVRRTIGNFNGRKF